MQLGRHVRSMSRVRAKEIFECNSLLAFKKSYGEIAALSDFTTRGAFSFFILRPLSFRFVRRFLCDASIAHCLMSYFKLISQYNFLIHISINIFLIFSYNCLVITVIAKRVITVAWQTATNPSNSTLSSSLRSACAALARGPAGPAVPGLAGRLAVWLWQCIWLTTAWLYTSAI